MSKNIGMCGIDCSICPWSKTIQDSMSVEEYEQFKIDCKKILGYSPTGSYQNCLGCQFPEDQMPKNSPIPLKNCPTRLCVKRNEIENCAYCSRFPCAYIKVKTNEWSREQIEKKLGKEVSNEDFSKFIEPFESFSHLTEIRSRLKTQDIVDAKTVPPIESKIIPFPINLKFKDEEITSFKQLHKLIVKIKSSPLGLKDTDVYAQQERLKNRIKQFLRFLWIFGTYADNDIDDESLTINAKIFIKNRYNESSLGILSFLEEVLFEGFELMGLKCDVIQLSKERIGPKGFLTPTGYLRDRNWKMKISAIGEFKCTKILRALYIYCHKLDSEYGKKSFNFFSKADMSILLDK